METTIRTDGYSDPGTAFTSRICVVCGLGIREDVLTCPRCGAYFDPDSQDTLTLRRAMQAASTKSWPKGQVMGETGQLITLEIGGHVLPLPACEELIFGRVTDRDDFDPDIDLEPFQARECGVSRCHMILRRRDKLIYVSDAGSRNGTWLNGHRLVPHAARLVRDGDEIQLGNLKMIIRFS